MPLTNPKRAILHLYPNIKRGEYRFRNDLDGQGIYLEYLHPSYGTPPNQAELEQAELDYVYVPKEITRRQWRLAVYDSSLENEWSTFFNARTPRQQLDFRNREIINRDYIMIDAFRQYLGYTETQIDNLFIVGEGL